MITFLTPDILFSFLTLSLLEIILGIDNLIFIALVVAQLPKKHSKSARIIGLSLAFGIRVLMLLGAKWIMGLTKPVLANLSFKDFMLIAGGLFLIIKSCLELARHFKGAENEKHIKQASTFTNAITQIVFVDFIFSFDSIITAIGITANIPVIIAAVAVSMVVMLVASGYLSGFLEKYPGFKILGIGFIVLIGIVLLAEGIHYHIPREYIYAALVLSIIVESLRVFAKKSRS